MIHQIPIFEQLSLKTSGRVPKLKKEEILGNKQFTFKKDEVPRGCLFETNVKLLPT